MKIEKRLLALTVSLVFTAGGLIAEDKQPSMPTGQEGASAPASTAPAAGNEVPQGSIEVLRLVLAKGVTDREPVDEITSAAVGDVVVGWTQIRSGLGEVTITHRWLHEAVNMGDVPLTVRSSPWRTWSRKTVHAPGNWSFQVLDPQGNVLQEKAFSVTAAAPAPAAAPATSPQ